MKMRSLFMKDVWLRCWVACGMAMIVVTLLPGVGPTPGNVYQSNMYQLNKIFHFIMFTLLIAVPLVRFENRKAAFFCVALIPALGFSLEYAQKNISGWDFSLEDMLVNNIGVLFGIIIGGFLRLRRRYHRRMEKYNAKNSVSL